MDPLGSGPLSPGHAEVTATGSRSSVDAVAGAVIAVGVCAASGHDVDRHVGEQAVADEDPDDDRRGIDESGASSGRDQAVCRVANDQISGVTGSGSNEQ